VALPLEANSEPVALPENSCRVLLVDDNMDATESLALLLQMSGHDVRTAHTGPLALEAAATFLPSIVLLDIGLPGLNGYEVARRLRKNPRLAGVWLVAMTGYGSEADVRLAHEAGFDRHMVKPVTPPDVEALLAALMATPRPEA
jgi:CheY-like chemotaxis protein